jgi:CheY-like chemotaxis protein
MDKKILVVDDSVTILAMMQDILESAGYEVLSATDGQEGLDMAKKERPNLIILDVMLPKLDGYQVCSKLKLDPDYKNIPIVFLSAVAPGPGEKPGQGLNANAYIAKPFDSQALLAKVAELLK